MMFKPRNCVTADSKLMTQELLEEGMKELTSEELKMITGGLSASLHTSFERNGVKVTLSEEEAQAAVNSYYELIGTESAYDDGPE